MLKKYLARSTKLSECVMTSFEYIFSEFSCGLYLPTLQNKYNNVLGTYFSLVLYEPGTPKEPQTPRPNTNLFNVKTFV